MASRKDLKPTKSNDKKRLQAIYAKSRREFSAADLQKFTVVEKGIPLENVIAAMERIQKNHRRKKA
jgi:hypothetical protein